MDETLWSIREAFDKRYRDLTAGWQQQRLNVDLQAKSFAAGLFEDWHISMSMEDVSSETHPYRQLTSLEIIGYRKR